MFKLRLISAIAITPLVVAGILYLSNCYVALASAIVFFLAAIEWLNMTLIKSLVKRIALLTLLILVAGLLINSCGTSDIIYWVSVVWWTFGFIGICYYPRGASIWQNVLLQPVVGLVMFVPAWLAFNKLHAIPQGPIWVLLGCCLIWGADIGAYAFGKLCGKDKLVPHVSPGKTWAGLYGGLLTSCCIMLIFYFWFKPPFSIYYAIWLALITTIFAVIGDLVESMLKRIYGFKDSGTLIPGHGGVYDRIDSMLAAFPIYLIGLQNLLNLRIMAV